MNTKPSMIRAQARRLAISLLATGAVTLAGCSLSTPYPSRSVYTITADKPDVPPATAPVHKDITLLVRRIVALEPFNNQAFVYRRSDNSVNTDYYSTFAAAPADLITSQLILWLRGSQMFTAVIDANVGLPHQWVIEGRIQDLSIDLSNSQKPQAVITAQIFLLDDSGAVPRVLFDKLYTERMPIDSGAPANAAAGWSAACRKLFARITEDINGVTVPAAN